LSRHSFPHAEQMIDIVQRTPGPVKGRSVASCCRNGPGKLRLWLKKLEHAAGVGFDQPDQALSTRRLAMMKSKDPSHPTKSPQAQHSLPTDDPATAPGIESSPSTALGLRFVTATALFDGHDASINIMRRLLQQGGAEVIHLGHNRSVADIVDAVVQEDAHAVAVSSYQGGHMEFFGYMRSELNRLGREDVRIFGGGGGVIIPSEIEQLHASGVTRIYSPDDGLRLGLEGVIGDMLKRAAHALPALDGFATLGIRPAHSDLLLARALTLLENKRDHELPVALKDLCDKGRPTTSIDRNGLGHIVNDGPAVIGLTGTGGAGKSSLTDEILRRFALEFPDKRFCVFSVDPTKRKTGGALLGDRIRMNALSIKGYGSIFMRSFATRGSRNELAGALSDALALARSAGFDAIFVETSGIGQGNGEITSVANIAVYVMTSEYGASTQLEKIDMLDYADVVAINKFDRRGAADAFREVKNQLRRSRFKGVAAADEDYPLFGTIAAKFNDDGVNGLYRFLLGKLAKARPSENWSPKVTLKTAQMSSAVAPIIPQNRVHYLAEVAQTVRSYHQTTMDLSKTAQLIQAAQVLEQESANTDAPRALQQLKVQMPALAQELCAASTHGAQAQALLQEWQQLQRLHSAGEISYQVRGSSIKVTRDRQTLSGLSIPKVALPRDPSAPEVVRFLRSENVPGSFPFTAGVFPFKRADEDPKRQFAGEGGPLRTNQRFHYLTTAEPAKRLSTAFDSVTLYGEDPAERPDIFGKVGESGVSIATLEDMKALYDGFDLCDTNTSVSMTINGPAPIILAFFMNTAIDQQLTKARQNTSSTLSPAETQKICDATLQKVRGTVQADILKEDQAQNTCIFSTDFALKMMGDVQEFFVEHKVQNYYSVSISGYHIAEAGANPISQLAFTLANGFTNVEYYLSRGMKIDDFAPNLSFFFSNGMDPEYSVIGRVARRIWSIAMRDLYGASERSQKLKYHIQTSGRSLHAQEIDFNDIRTTLQALMAIQDNCNSLHTNAYDEAITTPSEESVRRSMAIQLIVNREYGITKNENPLQGSYFLEALTDAVEAAVLNEFDRISSRGGVLGAMETQYQRGKIQDESLYYETLKHSGELPIIGVNTYLNPESASHSSQDLELARASYEEKQDQIRRLQDFQTSHQPMRQAALDRLQRVALDGGNIFAELLNTTRVASLGQITQALYAVGGQYRRAL
jgi:methylmalonyl-CoA mutase